MRVVATAGHVDHGKSTLVRAMTGVDPDRWPEEKARGLTIDLGFATTTLPSGQEIGFVDVPGHGRFVKNMLAGVSTVDACLFVVAATEGWKTQSEEHLRILELLGISHGLVALTKVGMVDDEWRELVTLDVQERLDGTFLAGSEVVAVDVPAGIGIAELRDALDLLVTATPAAVDRGWPRLWIDRSFPMRGVGTVVTGTLTGGSLSIDEEMAIQPGGYSVRVRSLQSHHAPLVRAGPGRRLAVNLTGVSHQQVGRGQALVHSGQWHLASTLDATLTVLESVDHPVGRRGAYVAHLGSGDFPVRLRVLGRPVTIEPGDKAPVRYWLSGGGRLPLLPGDRYVLREAGRSETIGGGEILDVDPVLPAARAVPSRSVERVIRERGWLDAAFLAQLTGVQHAPTIGQWVVDPEVLALDCKEIAEACRAAGSRGVDLARFSERHRAILAIGIEGIRVDAGRAIEESVITDGLGDEASRVLARLRAKPWSPPDLPVTDRGALRELERRGLAVQAGEVWFASFAVDAAIDLLAGLLYSHPEGFTVAAARDALATTRKHALPLLGHLDGIGVTRRRGDVRVAGSRMPASNLENGR